MVMLVDDVKETIVVDVACGDTHAEATLLKPAASVVWLNLPPHVFVNGVNAT